jgi:hypothetical protein
MDQDARLRRREEARRRTQQRRRRTVGLAVLVLAGLGVAIGGVSALGGDSGEADRTEPKAPPELPRGGRAILPKNRVVAYYGAPQDRELGALGIGSPDSAARRLARQARPYRERGRPVLPAFELISTVAASAPGPHGEYSQRQTARVISRYLRAARRHKALLILDIQPGRSPFMREVRALRRFLVEPDVSLALDPEWSMAPGQLPGKQIGSTDAATVNDVSRYLSRLVKQRNLPQKLLVVHRFTQEMIRSEEQLVRTPGVALVVNVDGFGDQPIKVAKYHDFTSDRRAARVRLNGFKLFYREDTNLMRPRKVLRLKPSPDLVVYE